MYAAVRWSVRNQSGDGSNNRPIVSQLFVSVRCPCCVYRPACLLVLPHVPTHTHRHTLCVCNVRGGGNSSSLHAPPTTYFDVSIPWEDVLRNVIEIHSMAAHASLKKKNVVKKVNPWTLKKNTDGKEERRKRRRDATCVNFKGTAAAARRCGIYKSTRGRLFLSNPARSTRLVLIHSISRKLEKNK